MSLISYLNSDSSGSSSVSPQVAQALQTIAAAKAKSTATTTSSASTSSVTITAQARWAKAEKDDASKTPAALASQVRAALDADYAKAGKKNSADLTGMSGRALATVALNESGQFSKAEISAAKIELRARDRQSIMAQINAGPLTASSLKAYTQQMLGARAGMSAEEQKLRDGNPNLR